MSDRPLLTGDTLDLDRGAPLPSPHLPAGSAVGRFTVLALVGQGGMGSLYKAYDPHLDRSVALKLVRAAGTDADAVVARERLLREARALARLSHPNVVTVYEVGTLGDEIFIAMEYVEGVTLRTWLATTRAPRDVLAVFLAAGEGLAAAHRAGLVHRDFKPDNVLVGEDGRVRVLDFGLARPLHEHPAAEPTVSRASTTLSEAASASSLGSQQAVTSSLTQAGAIVGTPRYMAPEQLAGVLADARSDQFSFCVALYEALYRRLPYPTSSLALFRKGQGGGRPKTPPTDAQVPRWVGAVVLRGLSAVPHERFASMDDVLVALRADPAVRRERFVRGAAVLAAVLAVGTFAMELRARGARICDGAREKLVGVWDDARRETVAAAFRRTNEPYADATFRGVAAGLDRFAHAWSTMHRDACEATHVRGEQSHELLDLRMACLGRRLEDLKAHVELFAAADAKVVEKAPESVQRLGGLDLCADGNALRSRAPAPSDPASRAKLEAIGRRLARVRALLDGGRLAAAAEEAQGAVAEARELHHGPTEAEAHLVAQRALDGLASYGAAEREAFEALAAAEAGRDDEAAGRAWTELVWELGERQRRYPEAHRAAALAEAKLSRLSRPEALLPQLHRNVGSLLYREGRYDEAADAVRRAITLLEKGVLGPEPPLLASSLSDLADAHLERGRLEEALAENERARALREKALGPTHPDVAIILNNEGIVYKRMGRRADALRAYERALAIRERALGPEHPHVGAAVYNLGEVLLEEGRVDDALAFHTRALSIFEVSMGPEHPDVGEALTGLAEVRRRRGETAIALSLYERALALEEKALGREHPALAAPLVGKGEALLAAGQVAAALEPLERGVALYAASEGDRRALARARFALGRALVEGGRDARRGRALVRQATEVVTGADEQTERSAMLAWLARHDEPGPSP